jgi:hypothetical protein
MKRPEASFQAVEKLPKPSGSVRLLAWLCGIIALTHLKRKKQQPIHQVFVTRKDT